MLKKVVYKGTVLAAIIALSLASISATSVFAAGQVRGDNMIRSNVDLASQWSTEVADFRAATFIDHSIAKWATEWKESKRTTDELHKDVRFTDQANIDLRQAETLVQKHPGFNDAGQVTNRVQANQTLQTLILDLHRFHMEVGDKLRALFSNSL